MPQLVNSHKRKARKIHTCSYCESIINIGEMYNSESYSNDGDIYTWKSHEQCQEIVDVLSGYIEPLDPEYGLNANDFQQGISDFCREFICAGCKSANVKEFDGIECDINKSYCLDKISEKLKKYDVIKNRVGQHFVWELEERSHNLG